MDVLAAVDRSCMPQEKLSPHRTSALNYLCESQSVEIDIRYRRGQNHNDSNGVMRTIRIKLPKCGYEGCKCGHETMELNGLRFACSWHCIEEGHLDHYVVRADQAADFVIVENDNTRANRPAKMCP